MSAAAAASPADQPPTLEREESLEFEKDVKDYEYNKTTEEEDAYHQHKEEEYDTQDLPPGRMHATRVPQRLSGSSSHLQVPPRLHSILRKQAELGSSSARSSRSVSPSMNPRSRSMSPAYRKGTPAGDNTKSTMTTMDSSISSLEDFVDSDILYDRQGFSELDAAAEQRKMHSSREFINLPSVNERLSEDTLEDCHAFSSATTTRSHVSSNASRVSHGSNAVLEPLDELSEEDDELSENGGDGETQQVAAIILTNMERVNLEVSHNRMNSGGDEDDEARRILTGESSEAPSAPTDA